MALYLGEDGVDDLVGTVLLVLSRAAVLLQQPVRAPQEGEDLRVERLARHGTSTHTSTVHVPTHTRFWQVDGLRAFASITL